MIGSSWFVVSSPSASRAPARQPPRQGLAARAALGLALVVCAVAPARAQASVLWRGDFSTGDLTQWPGFQAQAPDRLTLVTSPLPPHSHYALRTEVRLGDFVKNGCRAELVAAPMELEGADRYYSWSTLVPSDYPTSNDWQVFTQWHHNGNNGSPPLEFDLKGGDAQLVTGGSVVVWSAPFARGVWHDFVFHVKFSPSASLGLVELWLDGAKVLGPKAMATMYPGPGEGMWLKQGLYRNAIIQPPAVVFHAGMVKGETLADVAPWLSAPPPPPPPPPPATRDFSVAVGAPPPVVPGGVATFPVSIGRPAGFTAPVQLAASGLPGGATAEPTVVSDSSAQLVVATPAGLAAGSYAFTIIATAGGLTHQVAATLDVGGMAPPQAPPLVAPQGGGCSSPDPAMAGSLSLLAFLLRRARRRRQTRAGPA